MNIPPASLQPQQPPPTPAAMAKATTTGTAKPQQQQQPHSHAFPRPTSTLHHCPGDGADTRAYDDGGTGSASEDDEEEEDEDEEEEDEEEEDEAAAIDFSSCGVVRVPPPLIPPFRFAMVECARAVFVRGDIPSQSSSSSSSSVSLASAASLSNLAAAALSPAQSVSALATPLRAASERRGSINSSGYRSNVSSPAASPAAPVPSSAMLPSVLRQQSYPTTTSSTPHAAAAAAAAASSSSLSGLGLPPPSGPSPPTSPARISSALLSAVAPVGTASSTSASTTASASTPFVPVPSHSGRHICTRGLADQSVYRGAYPTLKNFHFLSRLRLRSIISLTPESPSADLKYFCRTNGGRICLGGGLEGGEAEARAWAAAQANPARDPTPIRLFHFPVRKSTEDENDNAAASSGGASCALTGAQAIAIVQLLCDANNLPAYVHCIDGCHHTSLLVGCLRKVQGWSSHAIYAEMLRFLAEPTAGVSDADRWFIERFNHNGWIQATAATGGLGKDATTAGGTGTASTPSHSGAVGASAGGGGSAASKSTAASAFAVGKDAASSAKSNPNILFRVPSVLPNWLWQGAHLAVHPLGVKLFDAHVPTFAALHGKQLAPSDPALQLLTAAAAGGAATTGATTAASASGSSVSGSATGISASSTPSNSSGSAGVSAAAVPSAVTAGSASTPVGSSSSAGPYWRLLSDEEAWSGALWDGIELQMSAAAIAEMEAAKKRKKKAKKAALASSEAAIEGAGDAKKSTTGETDLLAARSTGDAGADDRTNMLSFSKAGVTIGQEKAIVAAGSTAVPPIAVSSTPSSASSAVTAITAASPAKNAKSLSSALSLDAEAGSGSDATKRKQSTPSAAVQAGSRSRSRSRSPPADASTVAPAAAAAASSPAASSSSSPSSSLAALLSHPGEFHSLLDLDRTAWSQPLAARSLLDSDMLFHMGSFDLFANTWGDGRTTNASGHELPAAVHTKDADAEEQEYHAAAPVSSVASSLPLPASVTTALLSVRAALRDAALSACDDDQFVTLPIDAIAAVPAAAASSAASSSSLWGSSRFTLDEFDTDVSLLLASLALEGLTMNHKITRPMQLCHIQGEV